MELLSTTMISRVMPSMVLASTASISGSKVAASLNTGMMIDRPGPVAALRRVEVTIRRDDGREKGRLARRQTGGQQA